MYKSIIQRHHFIVFLYSLLFGVVLNAFSAEVATQQVQKHPPTNDFSDCIPDGYELDASVKYDSNNKGCPQYILTMSEKSSEKSKPLIMRYIEWNGKWIIKDSTMPSVRYENQASADLNISDGPNYTHDLRLVQLGKGEVIFLRGDRSICGSGTTYYYDFYTIQNGKLKLLKAFDVWSHNVGYACFYNNAFYFAKDFNIKGEKKGPSYVYTCYLEVTKYIYDGKNIVAKGTERMRENA